MRHSYIGVTLNTYTHLGLEDAEDELKRLEDLQNARKELERTQGEKTVLKANGELNAKYPNGIEAQKEKLEAEGHTIIQKGRKNVRYYVKDYENSLFDLK